MAEIYNSTHDFDDDIEALNWAKEYDFSQDETVLEDLPIYRREIGYCAGIKVWYDFCGNFYFYEKLKTLGQNV